MDELHRHRSFTHAGGDPFYGTVAHVAHGKDTGNIRLEQKRISIERPSFGPLPVTYQVRTREQKTALVLCDIDGMAYQDIADSLGTQIGTIKSRLSRARSSVRDCLKGARELLPTAYRLIIEDDDDRAS